MLHIRIIILRRIFMKIENISTLEIQQDPIKWHTLIIVYFIAHILTAIFYIDILSCLRKICIKSGNYSVKLMIFYCLTKIVYFKQNIV